MNNDDEVDDEELVAAAHNLIRESGDRNIVSISEVLDELSEKFDNRFLVTDDMRRLLWVIEELWMDPHIDRPNSDWIEFAWCEKPHPEPHSYDSPSGPIGDRFEAMRAAFACRGGSVVPLPPSDSDKPSDEVRDDQDISKCSETMRGRDAR